MSDLPSHKENVEIADLAVKSSPNENDCAGHDSGLLAAFARGRGSAGAKVGYV
jgi:L-asparaginase II